MFAPARRERRTAVSRIVKRRRLGGPRNFVKVGVPERELNRRARERLSRALTDQFVDTFDEWRGVRTASIEAVIRSKARREAELLGLGLDQVLTASQWHDALKGPLDIATVEGVFSGALREAYGDAIEQGARIGLRYSGVPGVSIAAERVEELAETWIKRHAGQRIVQINRATERGVRQILRNTFADEISPEAAANKIGRMVGLTDREANALRRFEADLVRSKILRPEDDTQYIRELIAQRTERKRDRMLRARGRRIAETEMQEAIIGGEEALYRELMTTDPEKFPPDKMKKRWMTVRDAHVCEWCRPLHLVVKKFEETYPMRGAQITRPPGHPKCRCYLEFSPTGKFDEKSGPYAIVEGPPEITPAKPARPKKPTKPKPAPPPKIVDVPEPRVAELELPDLVDIRTPDFTAKTSVGKWTDASGELLPERAALHDQIVEKFTTGARKQKRLHLVGGGPASGKGTVIGTGKVKLPKRAVTVDADEIKKEIPEFQAMFEAWDPESAAFTHAESSMISERIMAASAERRLGLVLDGTGDGGLEKLRRRVQRFRDQGYSVDADYMTLPTDTAVSRSMARATDPESRRTVPEVVIREIHSGVSRDFVDAIEADLFDNVKLWDTDVPRGDPPRLVYSKIAGQPGEIHDAELWEQFVAKGSE